MKKNVILFVFTIASLLLFISQANAWKWTISAPGTYSLSSNLDCTGDNGIYITADNVILDGAGYTIFGSDTGTGIYAKGRTGIIIKNCVVENFYSGIYLRNCNGCTVEWNTVQAIVYRHIRLRESSNCLVQYNNVDGSGLADQSIQSGLCISKSSATGNEICFNNLKSCGTKVARDSGTDSFWYENYYDDAIDWDCDGRAVYVIGKAADLNAYVVENGWLGSLPTYVDNDSDGYGVNCQLGPDSKDNNRWVNIYKEKVFDNLQGYDLDWQYICHPWWELGECDDVTVSIVPYPGPSAQCMAVAITGIDTTDFNYSQYRLCYEKWGKWDVAGF